MTYGRRYSKRKIMATSKHEQPHQFPLILPNGDSVDMEIFESCDYKISEYMKKYAFFTKNPSKICLNQLDPAGTKSLPIWNSKANPAEKIHTILSELIVEIRKKYPHSVSADEMNLLRDSGEICTILKEAVSLRNVPFSLLKTAEETTCFLINLTNLLFLHALIFNPHESTKSFTSMDWTARQSYFDSVGYIVGKYGFVSLYDLHSVLLKYPMVSTPPIFSELKFSSDSRIPFTIGQISALSPKIDAIHPSHLDEYLQSSEKEYHDVCSALNAVAPLSVPIPLFLKIERNFSDEQLLPHTFQNQPVISEKLKLLCPRIGKITPEEIVQKGIFIVNDPQVTVQFSYSNLEPNCLHRAMWKFCVHHVSFIHCCTDFMMTMKMYILGKRFIKFPDKDIVEMEEEINVFDVYQEIRSFTAHLIKEEFDSDDCPEEIRCLHNILSFIFGENVSENLVADKSNAFEDIFKILRLSIKLEQEFSYSFAKMRICQKIFISDAEIRKTYSSWSNLFWEQPSKILSLLVECGNVALASEFVEAQFLFSPFYNFQKEIFAVYLLQLCNDGETPLLTKNVLRLEEGSLIETMNILLNQKCQITKLKILVCCILQHFELSKFGKTKFYSLWMSFRMLVMISESEQYLFYNIVYSPELIVEQIVINRCLNILKRIMSVARDPFVECPTTKELEKNFREKVDQIVSYYAEKVLYFTKDLFLKEDSNPPVRKFTPPKKIPTIAEWVPDEKAPTCMLCKRDFTVFTRRHHCRRCGRVVCHLCSDHKLEIVRFELKVRVCDQCYEYEKPLEILENDILSPERLSETKIIWRLTGDIESDKKLRSKVTYENGPDIVFCMALVEQHTPNNILARFLSGKAEEMTKILRHRLIYSANFDYDHVAKCARSLSYAGKLLYSNLGDERGVRRCEEMANEIELLKVCSLVSYVPQDPNKPMRDVEQWSMIKDRLMNLGEWMKALEIASKIGADTKSIWFLWGISLIKSGDWMSAREKFKYSSIKTNPSALKEILDTIHSSVEKRPKFEEGLHYIRLYGNKLCLYQYYLQFCKFEEAMDVAFENDISPELFADTVMLVFFKNNGWESLLKQMNLLDPSHQYWVEHVKQFYKYCQNESDIDVLYEFVKFISDHYQIAICCIKYFLRDSRSYKDLRKNVDLLAQALEHMKLFQEQSEENRVTKNISKEKVNELLEEISKQIEINSIIWQVESVARQRYMNVPTIFNIKKTGDHLIGLLVKAINDVDKGFLYTIDLVSKYSLNCKACYCRATFGLAQQNRTIEIHKIVSSVMNWMKKHVPAKNSDVYIQVLDAMFINAVRGKPEYPMQFANRISDVVQRIDVLIETDQLKDALRLVAQLKNPYNYMKKLHDIATRRNLMWLKTIISQSLPEFDEEDQESVSEESKQTR